MTPDEKRIVKSAREIKKYCNFQYPDCDHCVLAVNGICGIGADWENEQFPKDWEIRQDWTPPEKGFAKFLMMSYNKDCIVQLTEPKGAFELITAMGAVIWSFPIKLLPSLERNGGKALLSDIAKEE